MNRERTREELQKENEELRALLRQVCAMHKTLGEALASCSVSLEDDPTGITVDSKSDVKKLLEKYSRL